MIRPTAMLLAIGTMLTGLADARAEGRPGYGGRVQGSLLGEPASLDPVEAASHAEVTVTTLLYDTLYRIDDRGRVMPHLAAALPRISADRRTARIPLVQGVLFHDGSALDADDVAASLARLAKHSRSGWLLAPVKSIQKGEAEVVLELRRDTPELATLLAAPQASITPRGRAPSSRRAIGSGPFQLRAFTRRGRRALLIAHDEHFAGRPYLDAVALRWYRDPDEEARRYERGLTHLSQRGAAAFAGHRPKYATEKVEGPATLLVYVGFGKAHPRISGSVEFRRALSLSISRNGFQSVGTGERVVPTIHPDAVDLGGEATERAERVARLDQARAALARAARHAPELRGGSGPTLEVIIDATRPDDREVAEKIVAALYRIGVQAKITELPARRFARRVERGACDLYVGQLAPPVAKPEFVVAAAFAAGGDDWTERMLAKARLRPEGTRVWFQQRLPIVPLFQRAVRVHHRINLRGVTFDRAGRLRLADIFQHGPAPLSRRGRP